MTVLKVERFQRIQLAIAWVLCWFIWIVALTWLAFDGIIFLLVQALLAAFVSTVATGLSSWVGKRAKAHVPIAVWLVVVLLLFVVAVTLLTYGKHLGFAHTYMDPNSQEYFVGLSQPAFLAGFFIINFAIVNLPLRRSKTS